MCPLETICYKGGTTPTGTPKYRAIAWRMPNSLGARRDVRRMGSTLHQIDMCTLPSSESFWVQRILAIGPHFHG